MLVIRVGHGLEARLVLRRQHGHRIAAEIRSGHGHDVDPITHDKRAKLTTKLVVRIGTDVVKLVDRNQPIIEGLDTQLIDSKAKRRMGADQHLVIAGQKLAHRFHFRLGDAGFVIAWGIAQVPLRTNYPVGPEAAIGELFVCEAAPD